MPSRFQEMLRTQRQNVETARAGLTWDNEEEDKLMILVSSGKNPQEVAKELQRTEGSIKTRLYTILCNKIDVGAETYQSVFDTYKVTSDELEDFRLKRKKREEQLQLRLQNKKSKTRPSHRQENGTSSNDVISLLHDVKRDLAYIKQYFKIQ